MINRLQKSLYRLGILSPIIIINFVLEFVNRKDISILSLSCLFAGIVLLVYHIIFIFVVNKKMPIINFKADSVPAEHDFRLVEIIISYAIPFIQYLDGLKNTNINAWMIVGICVIFVILTIVNKTCPSPVYLFLGYHYHTLESNGRNYTVISKRKNYRNLKEIRGVKRIFEDLLIIVE